MIEEILQKADEISQTQSMDEAARFLATYRRTYCEELSQDPSKWGDLIQIVSAQMTFLIKAHSPDKATGIAEWFLHTLHHLEESESGELFVHLKMAYRELFSSFFRRYAHALRDLNKIEEMRIAMRTALDLTREIPLGIVAMIHLYQPLKMQTNLENLPAKNWILDRYAEALAALDFAGLHETPFRKGLDLFQYALRDPSQLANTQKEFCELLDQNPEDIALKTLYNLWTADSP